MQLIKIKDWLFISSADIRSVRVEVDKVVIQTGDDKYVAQNDQGVNTVFDTFKRIVGEINEANK